jgi:hypothetical protein
MHFFTLRNLRAFFLAAATAVLAAACSVSPPQQAPSAPEPPAIDAKADYVSHVTSRTVDWDRVSFRRWLEARQLVSFFPKDQGLPGVLSTTPMRGTWGQNGAIRRVHLDNGHYAFDLILNNQFPDVFQYQVYGFTNEAARVAEYIYAELKYTEPAPGKTTLTWTYSMKPTSALTRPLASNFINSRFAPYMEAGMNNMLAAAQAAAAEQKKSQ